MPVTKRRELTERQKQILELTCYGLSRKQIAEQLDLRSLTVGTHLKNIYRKLDVHNRGSAVAVALGRGLVQFSGSRMNQYIHENYLAHVADRKVRINTVLANATNHVSTETYHSATPGLILKTQ